MVLTKVIPRQDQVLVLVNPFITDKKVKIVIFPTASSEARTVCILKLCVCISTASKYPNFLN